MEFVEGAILRDRAQAESAFDLATRSQIGDNLAATLARNCTTSTSTRPAWARSLDTTAYIERQLPALARTSSSR